VIRKEHLSFERWGVAAQKKYGAASSRMAPYHIINKTSSAELSAPAVPILNFIQSGGSLLLNITFLLGCPAQLVQIKRKVYYFAKNVPATRDYNARASTLSPNRLKQRCLGLRILSRRQLLLISDFNSVSFLVNKHRTKVTHFDTYEAQKSANGRTTTPMFTKNNACVV